jgi:Tol biopolymer transport system component/predicted Ser/Thr protein kinase
MPLAPGARLGPYEILSPIGAGGMGEVYKARDTRLDRTVAVKISNEAFSERFEREARVIASLNHPNICQLYDVGPNYLVMEFIEGAPIASVDTTRKLLDIAVQIAEGLAVAHAAGIVHRDLKPDNILIARDGRVKILDFGLAKAVATDTLPADATRTIALTDAGTTIGTISYMSPEQARGNVNLTAQSDQFSFGLVLYELATGHRAFQRDSSAEIMTAIIREETDPLPATVPAPLRWIVERLLAKDPADRYDSTRDLYRELKQVRDRPSETSTASGVQAIATAEIPARPKARSRVWLAFAGLAIALAAGAAAWMAHPVGGAGGYRFTPMEVSWENPSAAVWSPDAKAFAYCAGASGGRRLLLRYLNSLGAQSLTHAGDSWWPVGWSPDSKRVIVTGNSPDTKVPALYSVPIFGGEPETITPLDSSYLSVSISADGKALVATHMESDRKLAVYTADPVGSTPQRYTSAPFETTTWSNSPRAQFSPDRRSIVLVVDALEGRQTWKLPYPPGQGAPERIWSTLPRPSGDATPRWSWFPDGRSGVLPSMGHLSFFSMRSGLGQAITTGISSESQSQPALSPDGKKMLFIQSRTDHMMVSASLSDASVERVISSEVLMGMPAWAPHREEFVYASDQGGSEAIWLRGESGDRPIVTQDAFPAGSKNIFMTPALSPDSGRLIYTRADNGQHVENWISSLSGGPPVRLTNTKDVIERGGSWSPDGRQFVYWQLRNGTASVMVAKTSGEATPTMLWEKTGNPLPEWSPDGQWIKFVDGRNGYDTPVWFLISPDGKTVRDYAEPNTIQMTFSADSKKLYGIRIEAERRTLYSVDIATKEEKTIGEIDKDFTPSSYSNPGIRLSLSPDGKHILYPARRSSSSLWMLEGFEQPGWMAAFQ